MGRKIAANQTLRLKPGDDLVIEQVCTLCDAVLKSTRWTPPFNLEAIGQAVISGVVYNAELALQHKCLTGSPPGKGLN